MSQEGANLPQEVEGSHDQATAPHGSIPADVGSPTAITVIPAGSNPSSVNKLASAVNSVGSSEHASLAVLSADEDNNVASSKIASPTVLLHAGEDNKTTSKIASPAVLLADGENKAEFKLPSPTVLLASEGKRNDTAGSKVASPAMLHDCDNSKAGSHASVDNNAVQSKLASLEVLHSGDGNNGGSKIASPTVPHAITDNTIGSKLGSPAVLHAGEDKNIGFTLPNPAMLHANKGMENNAGWPKFASPEAVLLHAGEDNKARTKLAIQAISHAGDNAGSSRLTRSVAAALHAAKENASKLAIQVVPRPYAGKDNNAWSSKAATRPAVVDAGESNAKEGKNKIAREQRSHEADVSGGSRKDNAAALEDADPNLYIFTERERRKKMKNMFSTLHALLPQLPDKADKATIVGEAVTYIRTLEGTLQKLEKMKLQRKRVLAAQRQLVAGAGSSSRTSSARHPALALPAPAPAPAASSSREANLADMVHSLAQQAAVAAANKALAVAAAAAAAGAGGSGSGSSSSGTAAANTQLPRGAVPFPAPAAGFQTWSGQNVVVSVVNNEAYINLHCPRESGTLTKALFVLARHSIEVVTTTISANDGFRMYGIHARLQANPASASFPENLCAEDRFKLAVSEIVQLINT